MSKHSAESRIPSVLFIPDKVSGFLNQILLIRFPLERQFSGRDILLCLIAALLMLLSVLIRPLQSFKLLICLLSALIAVIPLCLQAFRQIRKRRAPLEEGTLILAAVLAFLLKEGYSSALILVFSVFLGQIEAYCLLHKEAAPEYLKDSLPKLLSMVESADEEKSSERKTLASAAMGFYLLFVFVGLLFAVISLFHLNEYQVWIHRCVIMLILSVPSAFIMSSLLTHFGAIYSAAKAGICFSGDQIPEEFSRCRLFAFSKTGAVTDGKFLISDIAPVDISKEDLLRIAAIAESKSDHPIAATLKVAAGLEEGAVPEGLLSVEEIAGKGVSAFFSGHQIYVGNAGLLEDHGIWYQIPAKSGSAVHVALDGAYRGYFMISDNLRENAFDALEELRAQGATTLVMLTGDVRSTARTLASSLNFDMVKPELNPKEKGSAIRFLRSAHGDKAKIACIGDGYHDAEMFEASDISICFDSQRETDKVDICIYSEDILKVPQTFRICRETERVFLINLIGLFLEKVLLSILGVTAVLPTAAITGIDFAFSAAAVLYALTCFTLNKRNDRA